MDGKERNIESRVSSMKLYELMSLIIYLAWEVGWKNGKQREKHGHICIERKVGLGDACKYQHSSDVKVTL